MIEVIPGVYRGPRPKVRDLVENKIDIVICFQSGFFEIFHEDRYEHQLDGLYQRYIIPCIPVMPPSAALVKRALDVVHKNLGKQRIYFHCAEGVDRTGWFAALLKLKYLRCSLKDVKTDMKQNGFHMYRFWWWLPMLESHAEKVGIYE